jgi:hypothetical protein
MCLQIAHARVVDAASNRVDVPPNPRDAVKTRSHIGSSQSNPLDEAIRAPRGHERQSTRRAEGKYVPHLAGVIVGRGSERQIRFLTGSTMGGR